MYAKGYAGHVPAYIKDTALSKSTNASHSFSVDRKFATVGVSQNDATLRPEHYIREQRFKATENLTQGVKVLGYTTYNDTFPDYVAETKLLLETPIQSLVDAFYKIAQQSSEESYINSAELPILIFDIFDGAPHSYIESEVIGYFKTTEIRQISLDALLTAFESVSATLAHRHTPELFKPVSKVLSEEKPELVPIVQGGKQRSALFSVPENVNTQLVSSMKQVSPTRSSVKSTYEAEIGASYENICDRPVLSKNTYGFYSANEELQRGTTKFSHNVPGYCGFFPADQQNIENRARGIRKVNKFSQTLSQTTGALPAAVNATMRYSTKLIDRLQSLPENDFQSDFRRTSDQYGAFARSDIQELTAQLSSH